MFLWAGVGTRQYLLGHANESNGAKGSHGGEERLLVVQDVAYPLAIVTEIGIIIASLSQALQCLITSPRLLQVMNPPRTEVFFHCVRILQKPHTPLFVN